MSTGVTEYFFVFFCLGVHDFTNTDEREYEDCRVSLLAANLLMTTTILLCIQTIK